MRYALSWSGGKDSTLALDRARRAGLDVACLFNIYEGSSGRVRFHGVRRELIVAQARALGLPLVAAHTHPDDYETVFLRLLDQLRAEGIGGIMFGNIHLADIRAWYEERTSGRGFAHAEPLWGAAPSDLIREFVARGYLARIVSIDLARARPEWLGARLDLELIRAIEAEPAVDLCGEQGEYHTFVSGGPLFRQPLPVQSGETIELEGHRFIDLQLG